MVIDHVIYATGDLDRGATAIESGLGLTAVQGGRHEGLGTENRIVRLGNAYLELLTVVDREEAAGSPLGAALSARIDAVGEGLVGWAVAVDAVEPVAERLGTELSGIAREGLTASLTGLAEALREPHLPFFITRDPGVANPGAVAGTPDLVWIEVSGDAERLDRWLGGAGLPVRVVDGEPGVRAVGVGNRELRTG